MVLLLILPLQLPEGGVTSSGGGGGGGGTPTLAQYLGKSGIDKGRGGSGTAAKVQIWNFDSVGPRVPTSGSLLVWSGQWPDNPTTGNGYHATCTAPCSPAPVDNHSNALTATFTVGSACKDSNGFDHNIWYEQNIASATTTVTDAFPQLISDNLFNGWVFYNVATTGGPEASNCTNNITPANNTAPNISGSAMTVTSGDLIVIQIDDQSIQAANAVTSITVPSGCSLTNDSWTPEGYGVATWTEYCIASSTSFTPQFTIAQSSHDTFSIYAAAFKAGAGGSAPATGPGISLESQMAIAGNASTTKVLNVGCPTGTTSLIVTDDAGTLSSVTDSNSNTFGHVVENNNALGTGSMETFWALGMTTTGMPNTYTVTLHIANTGDVDIITLLCTSIGNLDTGFTVGGGGTQLTTSTVQNSVTTSSGGALGTYTNLPTGTPGHSGGELFVANCIAGNGPMLQTSQPSGFVADFAVPAAVASIVGGDSDDYNNGDMLGHFYQNGTSSINFGWTAQNNSSSNTCMVTGFY